MGDGVGSLKEAAMYVTIEMVNEAIKAIGDTPPTEDERKRKLNQELDRLAGQHHAFSNPSGEDVYSPVRRVERYIEQGI